jgi:integrase
MPKTLLTDVGIRALKSDTRADYWDAKTPAFGLRVGRNSKTFVVKKGNRRLTIGRYGDWTLQRAREEAKRLLLQRHTSTRMTVAAALDLFVEGHLHARNRASTAKEHERLLRKHLASLMDKRIEDVKKQDLLAILRQLQRTPSTANHVFTVARIFFRWALKNDYVQHTPLVALTIPNRTQSRARVLSEAELRSVWQACEGTFGSIVRLLILTGQRRGEIAALQSDFFKDHVCTLPNTLTKNGREHSFPVGVLTASVLKPLLDPEAQLLFPARGTNATPFNGWSKSKIALDKASGVTDWTLHDLRRTFATRLAEMGVAPHIIERLLNHVSGQISGVSAIYNRATFMPEMRAAVGLWEKRLTAILNAQA